MPAADDRLTVALGNCIETAKEHDFVSPDVSDVKKLWLYRVLSQVPNPFIRRFCLAPLNYLNRYHPDFVRRFVESGYVYPQGQAVFLRGQINLLKQNSQLGDLSLCREVARWLVSNRNGDFKNHCWGQPFLWYSRKPFPPNLPRTTVSSQVAWAFLDLFDLTQDDEYLRVAESVCRFFLEDLNYAPDADGRICFSYTTLDNYHIHNASLLASSVLMRVGGISGNEEFRDAAVAATRFSVHHQNDDGSWYYWAPPDKLAYKIDNYHTGFNLEALATIVNDHPDSEFKEAHERGLVYFYNHLFDGNVPRSNNNSTWPVDIQACAQSIITFLLAATVDVRYRNKAREIAEYTVDNLFLESERHFAYRIYRNGHIDGSYYFRWGDAWMIRALSLLTESQ